MDDIKLFKLPKAKYYPEDDSESIFRVRKTFKVDHENIIKLEL